MASEKVYNPDVPDAKDHFNSSQLDFLSNFQVLYDAFARNHVALDDLTNSGNHTYTEFPIQNGDFQTDQGEISIYSRSVENQGDQIFLKYQGNQKEFQLSCYQTYSLEKDQYFTFLPGKVIMYFGIFSSNERFPTMVLNPPIAKKIISVNFTNKDSFSSEPIVYVNPPQNNIIKTLELRPYFSSSNFSLNLFYVILANI